MAAFMQDSKLDLDPFFENSGEDDTTSNDPDKRVPWSDPDRREKKPEGPDEKKPDGPDEQKAARGGDIPNPTDQDRARRLHAHG